MTNIRLTIDFTSKIKERSYSIYKSSGGELHVVVPKFSRTSKVSKQDEVNKMKQTKGHIYKGK